ncbi:MAG: FG-GAP-like repeat-containing protein [Thermoplasmata archaeon]
MKVSGRAGTLTLCLILALHAVPSPLAQDDLSLSVPPVHPHLSETYDATVEVQAGGRFFISFGPEGGIAPMALPGPGAGLSDEAARAVSRAPEWLRSDLAEKLKELAADPLVTTRVALGDFDLDGDPDIFCPSGRDLEYLPNLGTVWRPLYSSERAIEVRINLSRPFPASGDLTGDGQLELAVGTEEGYVFIIEFKEGQVEKGESYQLYDISRCPEVGSRAAPALGDLDGDGDLDAVVGDGAGRVHYFENVGNRSFWDFEKTAASLLFSSIAVPGPAAPELADLDGDGDLDLTVGGGNGILHFFRNIGTRSLLAWAPDDLLVFSGIRASSDAAPSIRDMNGDGRRDLLLAQGQGSCLYYENIGTSTEPAWPIWPFYEYTPVMSYYDPRVYLTRLNFSGATSAYARAILNAEDRIVDELAFAIAHSAVEALRASSPELYIENARSIYENDEYLDYVRVVDLPDRSTVRYIVNESGRARELELPAEIYYWYIVHPKITDELPLYIDPEAPSGSANATAPPPRGKFWRSYIFFSADPEYPPDPPTDANGDGVPDYHYPKTIKPPRLADMLSGIRYLWNCTSYASPPGFDDSGLNNYRPLDWGDHAIERVSNWVSKTLPLNERESGDGERPIQPVRIFHHHNGNCGELQDLTVAAARAALIPAAGVNLLGEDHVWIEFYERGWHQWDNYWSDSGSVIDNFMNYWEGWGRRGGSGIFKWRGDDHCFEVTEQYIPPPSQSIVTVSVRDPLGYPVDGARVFMMSHWLAEQAIPVEGISFPFPAIWNYTDTEGRATFVLAANNFTINVLSKLGTGGREKTYIGEGLNYTFNITLPGRLPWPRPLAVSGPGEGEGLRLEFEFEVFAGEQRPPNPEVGTSSVQPIQTGLSIDLLIVNRSNLELYLSGLDFEAAKHVLNQKSFSWTVSLLSAEEWYLVLASEDTLETAKTVRIRVTVESVPPAPFVTIDYPVPGCVYDTSRPLPVSGRLSQGAGLRALRLSIDDGPAINVTPGADLRNGTWRFDADLSGVPAGPHELCATIEDVLGRVNSSRVVAELDREPPCASIERPAQGQVFDMSSAIVLAGRAVDDLRVSCLLMSLDRNPVVDITSSLNGSLWEVLIPAGGLEGGTHAIRVTALDETGKSGSAGVEFTVVDRIPPELRILQPAELEELELGSEVVLKGEARDVSGIKVLTLEIAGARVDLGGALRGGEWSYVWNSSEAEGPGEVALKVSAVDGAGNSASVSRVFLLADRVSPEVCITSPRSGSFLRIGEEINITGVASDAQGVARLEVRVGELGWRSILGSLRGGVFRHTIETSGLPEGRCNITVRAFDASGNAGIAQTHVWLERPAGARPAGREGWKFIPGTGAPLLLAALAAICLARAMAGGRKMDVVAGPGFGKGEGWK